MPTDVDAAASSVTGGLLGRLGELLDRDARLVAAAAEDLATSWTGRSSVTVRRRLDALTSGSRALAAEVTRARAAFQGLATEAAEIEAALARLRSRAAVAGLAVEADGVRHRPGLRGLADPATESRLEATRSTLDDELARLRTRRSEAVAALLEALDPGVAAGVAAACRG